MVLAPAQLSQDPMLCHMGMVSWWKYVQGEETHGEETGSQGADRRWACSFIMSPHKQTEWEGFP